jgi:MaoC dehydratase-like protein
MREFSFGPNDIRQWAEFSGDRNPIHFDAERAQRIGASGVVVHGMLVMLAIKNHLGQALDSVHDASGNWWQFRCRLRHPVIAGDLVRIDTHPQAQGLGFTLTAAAHERKVVTGALIRHEALGNDECRSRPMDLSALAIAARADELTAAFPWIAEPWVILDAVLFSEFLRTGIKPILAAHRIDLMTGTSDDDAFVVQIAHEIVFDRRFFCDARLFDHELGVNVSEPEYQTIESGMYATTVLTAHIGRRAAMRTKLTIAVMQSKHSYQCV